jgi:hypothetical protein
MDNVWRWSRAVCLAALIGLVTCLPPAWAAPDAGTAPDAAVSAQPQHGGGGFALVLLHYRLALERLTEELRARSAELIDGAHLFPGEFTGAWKRVTEGASPLALIAGLLAILGTAFLARHAVRRGLAGAPPDGALDPTDRFGLRLGRALWRALIDGLALGAFALVAIGLSTLFVPAAGTARTFVFTYLTAALAALAAALVARCLLAPDAPGARLLPVADRTARFLYR